MSFTSLRFSGDPMAEISFTTVTFGLISVIFTMAEVETKERPRNWRADAAKDAVAVKSESVSLLNDANTGYAMRKLPT